MKAKSIILLITGIFIIILGTISGIVINIKSNIERGAKSQLAVILIAGSVIIGVALIVYGFYLSKSQSD